MIKSLKDARIVDGLPRILAKQPWVRALSEAMGVVHEMTMTFADNSQIYTDIDHVTEDVLDELAVNWKIDWYDASYTVEQKRRTVKTAITVRKIMGTAEAVKMQINAIYPGTTVKEWFEYGGTPGCFRVEVHPSRLNTESDGFFAELEAVKRFSAHLESIVIRDKISLPIYTGFAVWLGQRISVGCEIPPELDVTYLTDEHGNMLVTETGANIIL